MDSSIGNDQRSTYLSSNVKKLVCFKPDDVADNQCFDEIFFENNVLNWNAIERICSLNECFSQNGVSDYIIAISRLYPVSSHVHAVICQLTKEEFELKYENHLKWTAKSQLLIKCFDLLKSPQPGCLVTSLLLLTSTLERILGDIFITCSREAVTCPSLLKDLLKTQELRRVLGESFVSCLEVFIGSPRGLNLRNLVWHGFLSEGELPAHYVSFLLMLTISLNETMICNNKAKCDDKISERSLIKYSETTLMKDIFPNVETEDLRELFTKSCFVTTSMAKMWHLALDFFQQEKHVYVVMLLLPQLEHSLRRLYASVNEMPERVQTAESAEFYTTFNEILSPVLADGAPNKLLQFLEPCYIELLLDILIHPEGPRLRDHLSHGEVDTFHFPKYLPSHVLCIAIAFCLRFCSGEEMSRIDAFAEISKLAQDYSSIFHPFSCFRREFLTLIDCLLEWKNLRQPNEDDFLRKGNGDLYDKESWESMVNIILKQNSLGRSSAATVYEYTHKESTIICDENLLKLILRMIAGCKLKTLFRPRHELEMVALLRQVVGHCCQTSDQIQKTSKARYNEWENKVLRSRQRNNYKRFWFHLPFIAQTLCVLAVVVVSEFENIDKLTGPDNKKNKFLKKCLQCSENLASLSSPSKNRWLECNEVSTIWLSQVSNYYDHQYI